MTAGDYYNVHYIFIGCPVDLVVLSLYLGYIDLLMSLEEREIHQ